MSEKNLINEINDENLAAVVGGTEGPMQEYTPITASTLKCPHCGADLRTYAPPAGSGYHFTLHGTCPNPECGKPFEIWL